MSNTAVLRLTAPDGAHGSWRLPDRAAQASKGTLAQAAAALAGHRVTLLLPGTEVLITRVQVPAKGRSKAAAAIPWALEDRLVQEVETLHFALGPVDDAGEWPVAVIARERMEAYLAAVRQAGLEPHSIVAEPLALPTSPEQGWTVLEESGRITVRTGAHAGFSAEPELIPGLATTLTRPERIDRLRVAGADEIAWPEALQPALDAQQPPQRLDDAMAAFEPADAGIDLRQGPYSRTEHIGRVVRQSRVPAALAAAFVVLLLTGTALDYAHLGERQQQLRERMEQIFRETFPEVQRVVNPRSQMTTRLESLRGGGGGAGFLELMARAGEPLTGADGITLETVKWRNQRLQLELEATDLQVLDRLRERLGNNGLNAELERAERQGEQVAGEIRLTEASE